MMDQIWHIADSGGISLSRVDCRYDVRFGVHAEGASIYHYMTKNFLFMEQKMRDYDVVAATYAALMDSLADILDEIEKVKEMVVDEEPDAIRFEQDSEMPRISCEGYLTEWFGARCPDRDADCPCCQRWAALDALFLNPWREDDI